MPSVSIPTAIIGAAAIGGTASIASGALAAGAATSAAKANDALESQIYNQNSANEQPYINAGDSALTTLQGFLGTGGSASASQAALNDYLNSTGYQFNLNQGLNSVETSDAAKGLLGSGSTLEDLTKYAEGTADTYGQQYESNLQGLVNTGQGAANALAGEGENYANAVSSNNNSAASATGNALLSGASNVNSLLGSALTANAFASGGSSYGAATSPASTFNGAFSTLQNI